jgi:hypothetical protein
VGVHEDGPGVPTPVAHPHTAKQTAATNVKGRNADPDMNHSTKTDNRSIGRTGTACQGKLRGRGDSQEISEGRRDVLLDCILRSAAGAICIAE